MFKWQLYHGLWYWTRPFTLVVSSLKWYQSHKNKWNIMCKCGDMYEGKGCYFQCEWVQEDEPKSYWVPIFFSKGSKRDTSTFFFAKATNNVSISCVLKRTSEKKEGSQHRGVSSSRSRLQAILIKMIGSDHRGPAQPAWMFLFSCRSKKLVLAPAQQFSHLDMLITFTACQAGHLSLGN